MSWLIGTIIGEITDLKTGLENPGKSLNWKKNSRSSSPWKSVEVLESPGINFVNLQLCHHLCFWLKLLNKVNYLLFNWSLKSVPFSKIFPSSRSLNLLKNGLEKSLNFTLWPKGGHPVKKINKLTYHSDVKFIIMILMFSLTSEFIWFQ
jgi:hypothetical protein